MPLGIVSNEDFERELKRSESPLDELIIPTLVDSHPLTEVLPMERPGRKQGDRNVPNSLRKLIGEVSAIDGRQEALNLARDFGISPSSVSAYTNGSTSTDSMDKRPNIDHILTAKARIGKRARAKLRRALDYITEEKLAVSDASELAGIAKAMSAVSKDMEPANQEGGDGSIKPQFLVYSPTIVQENHFESIEARNE